MTDKLQRQIEFAIAAYEAMPPEKRAIHDRDQRRSIEARQALLDNRCERKHPKRHRTNKRRSKAARTKMNAAKIVAAQRMARKRHRNALVRRYWLGELGRHPK